METVNGVTEGEKGGPPPPSPLTGCYLLIIVGEPYSEQHKDIILQRIAKGLLSWDVSDCLVDLEKEIAVITEQGLEGEEARYGERLIQFASENLVTEILIHPVVSTLAQCMRNLLSSFTRHRHIIHAGYTFAANGSWALQDGTFSYADFSEAFQELEVQRVIHAYENGISLDLHCSPEGDWSRLLKESFTKACKVRVNPNDVLTTGSPSITQFVNYISPFLIPISLENLLESSDVVGNIRFSRPTLYVFPGGQGDAALFGINGFNMLLDGGFSRKACFWDFVRHLDRLDAVLMTRLNNSNIGGISSVLRRKKQDAVYPQIGHFFCNIQECKAILSPDGDKDKDPLLINLLDEGQEIISNLHHLNLQPQTCYRDSDPINLYHKVGHGTLNMYVLSPAKDSREVREFLQRWNQSDQKLFANYKSSREFSFPLQNLISVAALLVWQPANPNDTITRILYPGSSPQNKIFDGLDRLKKLEFIRHPVCTEKSLAPSSIIKKTSKDILIEKVLPKEKTSEKKDSKTLDNNININGEIKEHKEKLVKKSDSTDSERSTKTKKMEDSKIIETEEKSKTRLKPSKPRSESQQRKKTAEKKPSPTTPKKTVENGDVKKSIKRSPIGTPAKSAKDANNRKVVENKAKTLKSVPIESKPRVERKPISRRPKGSMKPPISPVKKLVNGIQKPDTISRRGRLDKEGTTDSSTVSTPSAEQDSLLKRDISKLTPEEIQQLKVQELADLKEEQEAVKEIEAVFRKGEIQPTKDDLRKINDISIEDKIEKEEYLIIEKEEIDHDSLEDKDVKEDEIVKLARDSEESEKERKLSTEEKLEIQQQAIQEQVNKIVTEAEGIVEAKEDIVVTGKDTVVTSPEEKIDFSSTDKKITDKEIEEVKDIVESHPDEKVSIIKSGDTTTAPTLPEDERIPLDEIKEDNGRVVEEKYVREETKEKDVPIIQLPPKTFEVVSKVPGVVGIKLDKQSHIRDIVKTPDEVADLPVHEEVDYEYTHDIKAESKTNDIIDDKKDANIDYEKVEDIIKDTKQGVGSIKEQTKEVEQEKDKDEVVQEQLQDVIEDAKKPSAMQEELKHLTEKVLENEVILEKDILKDTNIILEKEPPKSPVDLNKQEFKLDEINKEKEIEIINQVKSETYTKGSKLDPSDILEKAQLEVTKELGGNEKHDEEKADEVVEKETHRIVEKETLVEDTLGPELDKNQLKKIEGNAEETQQAKDTDELATDRESFEKSKAVADINLKEIENKTDETKHIDTTKDVDNKDTKSVEELDTLLPIDNTMEKVKLTDEDGIKGKIAFDLSSTEKSEKKVPDGKQETEKSIPEMHDADILEKAELETKEKCVEVKPAESETAKQKVESSGIAESKVDPADVEIIIEATVGDKEKPGERKTEKEEIFDKGELTAVVHFEEQLRDDKKESIDKVHVEEDTSGLSPQKKLQEEEQVVKGLIEKETTVKSLVKKEKIDEQTVSDILQEEHEDLKKIDVSNVITEGTSELKKSEIEDKIRSQEHSKIHKETTSQNDEKPKGTELDVDIKNERETTKRDSINDENNKDSKRTMEQKENYVKLEEVKKGALVTEEEINLSQKKCDVNQGKTEVEVDSMDETKKHFDGIPSVEEMQTEIHKHTEDAVKTVKEDKMKLEKIEDKLHQLKEKSPESSIEKDKLIKLEKELEKRDELLKATKEDNVHLEKIQQSKESTDLTTESVQEYAKIDEPTRSREGSIENKDCKTEDVVEKMELGRKSPKEREEDVIKIVASVAEVLKSDAPLEEFEGKLPISTYSPYTTSYTTELRETHITTVDSPIIESKVIKVNDITPIPEEPHAATLTFLEEERKIAPVHEKLEDKRSSLLKESQEFMMATSKMISDIKSGKPEDKDTIDESSAVHRMLVTASSEDGGEETEICPEGTILFSKSSESSGRSSPEKSQDISKKSSIVDTISDSLSTVKQVRELHSEKDSGIDDVKSEIDMENQEKIGPGIPQVDLDTVSTMEVETFDPFEKRYDQISGISSPDKDASITSLASGKSTPDLSDLEKSKEIVVGYGEDEIMYKIGEKVVSQIASEGIIQNEDRDSCDEGDKTKSVLKETEKELTSKKSPEPKEVESDLKKVEAKRDSLNEIMEDVVSDCLETVRDFSKSLFEKDEKEFEKATSDLEKKLDEIKAEDQDIIDKTIQKGDETIEKIKEVEERSLEQIEEKIKDTLDIVTGIMSPFAEMGEKKLEEASTALSYAAENLEKAFIGKAEATIEQAIDLIENKLDDKSKTEIDSKGSGEHMADKTSDTESIEGLKKTVEIASGDVSTIEETRLVSEAVPEKPIFDKVGEDSKSTGEHIPDKTSDRESTEGIKKAVEIVAGDFSTIEEPCLVCEAVQEKPIFDKVGEDSKSTGEHILDKTSDRESTGGIKKTVEMASGDVSTIEESRLVSEAAITETAKDIKSTVDENFVKPTKEKETVADGEQLKRSSVTATSEPMTCRSENAEASRTIVDGRLEMESENAILISKDGRMSTPTKEAITSSENVDGINQDLTRKQPEKLKSDMSSDERSQKSTVNEREIPIEYASEKGGDGKQRKESITELLEEGIRDTVNIISDFGKSLIEKGEKWATDEIKTTAKSFVAKDTEATKTSISSESTLEAGDKTLTSFSEKTIENTDSKFTDMSQDLISTTEAKIKSSDDTLDKPLEILEADGDESLDTNDRKLTDAVLKEEIKEEEARTNKPIMHDCAEQIPSKLDTTVIAGLSKEPVKTDTELTSDLIKEIPETVVSGKSSPQMFEVKTDINERISLDAEQQQDFHKDEPLGEMRDRKEHNIEDGKLQTTGETKESHLKSSDEKSFIDSALSDVKISNEFESKPATELKPGTEIVSVKEETLPAEMKDGSKLVKKDVTELKMATKEDAQEIGAISGTAIGTVGNYEQSKSIAKPNVEDDSKDIAEKKDGVIESMDKVEVGKEPDISDMINTTKTTELEEKDEKVPIADIKCDLTDIKRKWESKSEQPEHDISYDKAEKTEDIISDKTNVSFEKLTISEPVVPSTDLESPCGKIKIEAAIGATEKLANEKEVLDKSVDLLEHTLNSISDGSQSVVSDKSVNAVNEKEEATSKSGDDENIDKASITFEKCGISTDLQEIDPKLSEKGKELEKCGIPDSVQDIPEEILRQEEEALKERAEDLTETFETVTDMSKSIAFEKCDKPEDLILHKEEKVLAERAKDLTETFDIVTDMTKSLVFERCESLDKRRKSIEDQFVERTADDLEEAFETVSDMSKSIVFEKCEKGHKEKYDFDNKIDEKATINLRPDKTVIENIVHGLSQDVDTKAVEAEMVTLKELPVTKFPDIKAQETAVKDVLEKVTAETDTKSIEAECKESPDLKTEIDTENTIKEKCDQENMEKEDIGSKDTVKSLKACSLQSEDWKAKEVELESNELSKDNVTTVLTSAKDGKEFSDVGTASEDSKISTGATIKDKTDVFQSKIEQKTDSNITESTCDKTKESNMPETIAGPSAITELPKDVKERIEVANQKEVQDTLLHEKHIPGSVTPPTVPVSPSVTEFYSDDIKLTPKTESLIKSMELRSSVASSDDFDIKTSTEADIPSGYVFKIPDSDKLDSDEELSAISQVPYSKESSECGFKESSRITSEIDPMSMSFYGTLPDDEAVKTSDTEAESTYLYEITKAKYSASALLDVKADETHVKPDQTNKSKQKEKTDDPAQSATKTDEKDPIEMWGKPLGLPTPSTCLYEITKAKYSCLGETSKYDDGLRGADINVGEIDFNEGQDVLNTCCSEDIPLPIGDKDLISSWGKPLGLPSPAPPTDNKGTPKKERKLPPNVSAKNKLNDDKKRAESPSKYKNKKVNPVYVDLTYVPHHGNSYYSYVDFFKRVRARYYVFSGIEPSKEVYNALLEAKQTWENKDLEVTIIPTYDTDILGYWVAENDELLTKYKIDLSPSASRCTINLQDHETSCSAYRLEF